MRLRPFIKVNMRLTFSLLASFFLLVIFSNPASADPLQLYLRSRQETAPQSGLYRPVKRNQQWKSKQTAIVVCDMWTTTPAQYRASRRADGTADERDA
jgi:hypothetical protein